MKKLTSRSNLTQIETGTIMLSVGQEVYYDVSDIPHANINEVGTMLKDNEQKSMTYNVTSSFFGKSMYVSLTYSEFIMKLDGDVLMTRRYYRPSEYNRYKNMKRIENRKVVINKILNHG